MIVDQLHHYYESIKSRHQLHHYYESIRGRHQNLELYALTQNALGNTNTGMVRHSAVRDTYAAIINGDYDA